MKNFIKKILLILRPLVRKLARIYDIKLIEKYQPHGQGNIIFEEPMDRIEHLIPSSTYFNTASGDIHIGKNVTFGENVLLLTGKHYSIEDVEKKGVEFSGVPTRGRDIFIEESAYIGSGAIIVGPCKVGRQSVVGAGAVVIKDVPPRCLVVGNPATVKKYF